MAAAASPGMLFPLDVLYVRCGVAPPVARRIAPQRLPPVAAALLCHDGEMTQTLERHVGDRLLIRVMSTMRRGGSYFRRALLAQEQSARPVAMGAVRLRLGALNPKTRARILRECEPLGRVLREGGAACRSLPVAFFRVVPNPELMAVFGMREAQALYGRQTRLMQGDTRIGDIVEILTAL